MVALALYGAVEQRRLTTTRVQRDALRLLQIALTEHQAALASTASRLDGLALAPETRLEPHAGCDSLLRALDARWPDLTSLGLFDGDGRLHCSSVPDGHGATRAPTPAGLPSFIARTSAADSFTVGRPFYEAATGLPLVMTGQPVRSLDGRVTDVVTAAVRLRWLERFARDTLLPRFGTIVLLDAAGGVLFRAPDAHRWSGGSASDLVLFRALRTALRADTAAAPPVVLETTGLDGEPRIYAAARLAGPADAAPYLAVGLSRRRAVAEADRLMWRDLRRVGGLTLLTIVVALLVGELLVLRRVRALVDATERIAGGRLDLGTGVPHDAGEVGRIAEAVDRMTVALRARATEAEHAVAALRRGEERYRSLVLGTSQIVWALDPAGFAREDMPSWRAVTGQTVEEALGLGWFDAVHPDDRAAARKALRDGIRRHGPISAQYRLRTAAGDYRHYRVHGVPLFEEDGRTIREWVGFCVDVTEQRTAEEALRRSEETQRQGQKLEAVGRLAGGIAHDFNNLLTAIRSYSELVLEDEGLAEQHRDDVREIQKASDRAAALVRQLLAFSRRQPMQASAVELDGVVRDMDAMLRRLIGAEFTLDLRAAAPGARVRGDRAQLEQVVLNLVLNARDAMPEGGTIAVATALRDGPDDGAWVELTVRDTGVGMDAATRARVFEPFFTTKAPGAGTGLGLATVYGAVQQAGGEVEVESEPGAGTTFRVRLPRVAIAAPTPAPQPTVAPPRGELPAPHGTVLLADDEGSLRHAAARLLHRAGYTVLEAEHGGHALALWREHRDRIGLLLTDMRMPVVGGVELAERLRAEQPTLPVIFMSAFSDELDARAKRTVPDALRVAKPFEVRAFVETVHEAMSKAAVEGAQ